MRGKGQHRVISSPCPTCMLASDAATVVVGEDAAPQEGDATICVGCGEILVFNAIGATEKMGKERLDSLPEENRKVLLGMQKFILEVKKKILGQ